MEKWVKNASELSKTWGGVVIQAGTYHQIDPHHDVDFRTDSNLLSDIGSQDAIMSRSNSSDDHITDVSAAIDFLKNIDDPLKDTDGAYLVRPRAFSSADNFRFRGKGMSGTATAGQTTNIDYCVSEERFINGVNLILNDHSWGDKVHFEVVDVDDVLGYGENVVLDRFGDDWFVDPSIHSQGPILLNYPARIISGLYIRVVYVSAGSVNVDVEANLFLHKPT